MHCKWFDNERTHAHEKWKWQKQKHLQAMPCMQLKCAIMRGSFDWGTYFCLSFYRFAFQFISIYCCDLRACVCSVVCNLKLNALLPWFIKHFSFHWSIMPFPYMYCLLFQVLSHISFITYSLACIVDAYTYAHNIFMYTSMRFKGYLLFIEKFSNNGQRVITFSSEI